MQLVYISCSLEMTIFSHPFCYALFFYLSSFLSVFLPLYVTSPFLSFSFSLPSLNHPLSFSLSLLFSSFRSILPLSVISFSPSISLSLYLSLPLSLSQSNYLSICLSIYESAYLSVYLCIRLSVRLSLSVRSTGWYNSCSVGECDCYVRSSQTHGYHSPTNTYSALNWRHDHLYRVYYRRFVRSCFYKKVV